MAELMGICGADGPTTARVLDRMANHVAPSPDAGQDFRVDRFSVQGFGLLRFGHGTINPHPQPIVSEATGRLIAMDGELFDTAEARRLLEAGGRRFRYPDSDAELLLALYEDRGEAAFGELNGSFSAAIFEPPPARTGAGRLLLATDRGQSRPIFHGLRDGALAFSSRFNALAACGWLDGGRLDTTAVMTFFTFDDLHDAMTYYREARAMPPAGLLRFADGQVTIDRYWRPTYGGLTDGGPELADRLAETLARAARRMTADTLRHGVMLSGGLDSRALLAGIDLSNRKSPLRTYTTADFRNREVRTARRIARAGGCDHAFLPRPPDHYAAILDRGVELAGGMGRFDHCHFVGLLDRVRDECDAVFIEEPTDRMFKGYYWDRRWFPGGVRVPVPMRQRFTADDLELQVLRLDAKSAWHDRPWLLFREPLRSAYLETMRQSIRDQLADAGTDDPYHLVEHVAGQRCPGRIASFQNIACVRTHLEYRCCGFDRELIDLSPRIPPRWRMGGWVLRQAIRRLDPRLFAIADANTGVPADAPAPLAWACRMAGEASLAVRRRLRLAPPWWSTGSWPNRAELARTPAFVGLLERTLFDPACLEPSIFDLGHIRRLLDEHLSRRRSHAQLLMSLLTFGRWFRLFGPGRT